MADTIMDVGPVDMSVGYGNPGAAGFYGLQKELLRRAAMQRQAEMDARQQAKDALDAEIKRESVASLQESRSAAAEENRAKASALKLGQATAGLDIGTDVAPETKAAILRFGNPSMLKTTPAQPAMMGGGPIENPTPEDFAQLPPVEAKPEKTTYAGTPAQKTDATHVAMAKSILNGDYDTGNDTLDAFNKARALEFLSTGKEGGSIPAGVITPKTQTEKDATRYHNTRAAQTLGQPVKPEDAAFADSYEKLHPTESTKQEHAVTRIEIGQTGANKRQTSTQTFQTKQQFRRELSDNEKAVDKDIERSDRALKLLDSPNFVTDAVAGPEFLQIVAGGMGSGLRMTDAELRRINDAQTKIDQFKGYLAKWDVLGIGQRRTIQDEMRGQMRSALEAVHAARERKAAVAEETLKGLEDADTQDEIDQLHSKYWSDRRAAASMVTGGAGAKKLTADELIKKYGGAQ